MHEHLLQARLRGDAVDNGVVLRCPTDVTDLQVTSRRVRLTLSGGDVVAADVAVLNTGRWTEPLGAAAGQRVPMLDTRTVCAPIGRSA